MLQGRECRYRIALNGIERSAQLPIGEMNLNIRASAVPQRQKEVLREALKQKRQKQINSSYAAVLDIDTYRDEPKELDLGQFLKNGLQENLDRFRKALPQQASTKGK